LNAVPSNSSDADLYHSFAAFAHIDNHLYHFFDMFINLYIFLAIFTHLAHLAINAVQRKAVAIATHHTHQVATATATVIVISVAISHNNWAFSSLRLNAQYHIISL
jgi:hypothetical protein